MATTEFQGFAGLTLRGDLTGDADAPPVLLLHGAAQSRFYWEGAAAALVQAGRQVLNLDLRGHGQSDWSQDGRYDIDAFVADLRAVLAQMSARPVIVATSLSGWVATLALGEDGGQLVSGLVLVNAPPELDEAAGKVIVDAMQRRAAKMAQKPDWDVRVMTAIDPADVTPRLNQAASKLAFPVLFVRGAENAVIKQGSAEAFVRCIANAEYVEIERDDSGLPTEQSDAFNAVLLEFIERRAPRRPGEYRAGSDPRTLRDALGCFATGITIVTAMGVDGQPIGLTANSFTSVSLDPPLLLVCIARSAGSAAALEAAGHFAVNVLQIGQQPASNKFASRVGDRFADTPWTNGSTGVPILTGSLSIFECSRHAVHDGGDHLILVGQVVSATFEPSRDPLLYFRGKYRRLHFA